jgi:cytochrome c oxidase assembly protein subunit 15
MAIIIAVFAQIGLGIWTLLAQVPISLGLMHQGGALVLLTVCIWHLHLVSTATTVVPSTAGAIRTA